MSDAIHKNVNSSLGITISIMNGLVKSSRMMQPGLASTTAQPSTTTGYLKFALNFVDSPEFQEKMADILGGGSRVTPILTTTTPTPVSQSTLNFGLLIPVVVIGVFMLIVGICVLWHTWYDRIRTQKDTNTVHQLAPFNRSTSPWDEWRGSVRSTTPLRRGSSCQLDFVPRLGKISESPEDKLSAMRQKIGARIIPRGPDESMTSILSNFRFDIPTVSQQTPYLPDPPGYIPEISHSYPNLELPPQAPFSPYHLTWVSPMSRRAVYSEPNLMDSSSMRTMPINSRATSYESSDTYSYASGYLNHSTTPWKSPYHPNFNTPTNGSDTDSNFLPSQMVLNYTHSTNTPDVSMSNGPIFGHSMEPTSFGLKPGVSSGSLKYPKQTRPSVPYNRRSSLSSPTLDTKRAPIATLSNFNTSQTLSCPGNVGEWQYRQQLCNQIQGSRLSLGIGKPMDIANRDMPSTNTSMCAMIGSTDTSVLPFGLVGQNAFDNTPWSSANTSTCAHMDSYENSHYSGSSTITGSQSENSSSVYNAAPSHSTSIDNNSMLPSQNASLHNTRGPSSGDCSRTSSQAASSTMSMSVHSAPAVMTGFQDPSFVWDSFSKWQMSVNQAAGVGDKSQQSFPITSPPTLAVSTQNAANTKRTSLPGPGTYQADTSHRGTVNPGFEWDAYPFYTSFANRGTTLAPPAVPQPPKWSQPLLADLQYWV